MNTCEALIAEGLNAPIRGWDFSWLSGRVEETRPPWNYPAIVGDAAASSRWLLDIDTGGGEFLARLAPFPGSVVATEGHAPNMRVAQERLAPFGIQVVETASAPDNEDQAETSLSTWRSQLPFASAVFDLVTNRHSSYWPSEIRRVMCDGGRFVISSAVKPGPAGARGRISLNDHHTPTGDSTNQDLR